MGLEREGKQVVFKKGNRQEASGLRTLAQRGNLDTPTFYCLDTPTFYCLDTPTLYCLDTPTFYCLDMPTFYCFGPSLWH